MFRLTEHGGPRLLCVDLESRRVVKKILFPHDVALPTTYLNDVRFERTPAPASRGLEAGSRGAAPGLALMRNPPAHFGPFSSPFG